MARLMGQEMVGRGIERATASMARLLSSLAELEKKEKWRERLKKAKEPFTTEKIEQELTETEEAGGLIFETPEEKRSVAQEIRLKMMGDPKWAEERGRKELIGMLQEEMPIKAEELALRREELGLRRKELGFKEQKLQKDFIEGLLKGETSDVKDDLKDMLGRVDRDLIIKRTNTALDAARSVTALLDTGNPISDIAMRLQMPRLLGEVGNLTREEQRMFGGSSALTASITQFFERWRTGKLTEENKRFLYEVVNTMQDSAARRLNKRLNSFALQVNKLNPNISVAKATELLSPFFQPTIKRRVKKEYTDEELSKMSDEEIKELIRKGEL